jgi:glycosyltransferase involved in cell wall biosynthesis
MHEGSARRADAVIVPSQFVRHRAIELLGLPPQRVHAVPWGLDHELFRTGEDEREQFLLYPARPWPHKNHATLYAAFARLRAERPELRLVLTGAGHDPSSLPPGVEARGDVPVEVRVDLYRRAAATVVPSLYEGFGLPPLEAMACGCPVAASAAGSLPEVVGGAAVLFDPHDADAIAAGVSEALARAAELGDLGIARAARFTWEATARAHDRVYALARSS